MYQGHIRLLLLAERLREKEILENLKKQETPNVPLVEGHPLRFNPYTSTIRHPKEA